MNAVRRARLVTVAVLAIVFGSGIVVGFALDRRWTPAPRSVEGERLESGATAAADDDNERPRRYLFDRVDPTPEQRMRIDSIVAAYQSDLRAFHRESRRFYDEGTRALVVETREAIMGVLTPEQAARYDSLTTARDRRNDNDRNDGEADGGGERK